MQSEGVVTLADSRQFASLMLLYQSIQDCYPVPVTCFDGGLTPAQRQWAGIHMPACQITPIPDTPEIAAVRRSLQDEVSLKDNEAWLLWICPFLVEHSPTRRTLWLDADITVLRDLGLLFTEIDYGPVFTRESHDSDRTPIAHSLYALLPIDRPFRDGPIADSRVSGWDLERDRELLRSYQFPVLKACNDDRIRHAIVRHSQAALMWALHSTGKENRVLAPTHWNFRVENTYVADKTCTQDRDILSQLQADYPDTQLVNWNGIPRGQKLATRLYRDEDLTVLTMNRFLGRNRRQRVNPQPQVKLICHLGVGSSPGLIGYFLDHYYRLGVNTFFIALHSVRDDPRRAGVLAMLKRYGVTPVMEVDTYSAVLKHQRVNRIVDQYCDEDDWVLYADIDELQVFPEPLKAFLARCDNQGHSFVRGHFVDRIAENGELIPVKPDADIWEQFPYSAPVTRRICGGWYKKVCLARADGRHVADGGSHALDYGVDRHRNYYCTHRDPRGFPEPIEIHHFKWDQTLRKRLIDKVNSLGGDRDATDGDYFIHEYHALLGHLASSEHFSLKMQDAIYSGTPALHYTRGPVQHQVDR